MRVFVVDGGSESGVLKADKKFNRRVRDGAGKFKGRMEGLGNEEGVQLFM